MTTLPLARPLKSVDLTDDFPLAEFGVAVSFVAEHVVVGVRGEVDLISAPELSAFVNAVIDRGHQSIVLDLTDLQFIGAAGLSVIADGLRRLQPAGELTIRSASPMLRRLLAVTGMAPLVRLEIPEARAADPVERVSVAGASTARFWPTFSG